MRFPIYDISEDTWKRYRLKQHNILYENPFPAIIPFNHSKYKRRIKEFKFVDPDGNIYKVVEYQVHSLKGLSRLFPFYKRIEYQFVSVNEQITFTELKNLLISRALETNNKQLEDIVQDTDSIDEILKNI